MGQANLSSQCSFNIGWAEGRLNTGEMVPILDYSRETQGAMVAVPVTLAPASQAADPPLKPRVCLWISESVRGPFKGDAWDFRFFLFHLGGQNPMVFTVRFCGHSCWDWIPGLGSPRVGLGPLIP